MVASGPLSGTIVPILIGVRVAGLDDWLDDPVEVPLLLHAATLTATASATSV
jgi:hypothetical protein